ncbi:MAG: multicopper oxidase domain-containing protein [Rhodoferax sp.]|uniref:multicopper oxidase domain-containing protein n=1 Tax=Rhodoferax sp. TaxID=50421 RepID=UPI003016B9C0
MNKVTGNSTTSTTRSPCKLTQLTMAIAVALGAASHAPLVFAGPGTVTNADGEFKTYYANSPLLRKFIDPLTGILGVTANQPASASEEYIPVAVADTVTYPGSEYFVIGVVEHAQKMHTDLKKATTLRSYVQLYPQGFAGTKAATARALSYPNGSAINWPGTTEQVWTVDKPHYLGPMIVTAKGTPVRIKMMNFLPTGRATLDANGKVTARNGDIFLPVDESLPGAGTSPTAGEPFPQNRVAIHMHGGDSPWISDGTPHQWFTAAGDASPFKRGANQVNVPDMADPGEGGATLFYANDQSSRLMWYHDHAFGITRQNAYAGEAAPYLITDPVEEAALGSAVPSAMLALVLQDKSFVPSDITTQDSLWDTKAWGEEGDLWYPHVYEPNTLNTGGSLVSNPAGRWDFGPTDLSSATTAALTLPDGSYGHVSSTPEAYMDTPVINGVAYPTLSVEPKAYRVRFLNGANDRYFNLSLWVADSAQSGAYPDATTFANTEVKMVAGDGREGGVPDPLTAGPAIIQFGNEAGLLPAPVVHAPTPMKLAPESIESIIPSIETGGGFYLGSAERGDTVIDFSQYAGKTLIMYNDSTAPVPAGDPRYDYYTGNPDQTLAGGAPSTLPGYGPNTRTIMQIKVAAAPAPVTAFDTARLTTAVAAAYATSADPKIITGVVADGAVTTNTLPNLMSQLPAGAVLKVKTIEGGFDVNFGRLIANFGVELNVLNGVTPLAYIDAPTDIVSEGETQFWHLKNHDADNHPIHFHLFNVQVIARVQADGFLRNPEPNEAGWKETVQNWPSEEVIVALKPKTPALPFGLPDSVRLMDPTMNAGVNTNEALIYPTGVTAPLAFQQFDLVTGLAKSVANVQLNYGWEYVFHCHILGHEENDLMRPLVYLPHIAQPGAPTNVKLTGNLISWTDATPAGALLTKGNPGNEIGFRVERTALKNGLAVGWTPVAKVNPYRVNTLANATSLVDSLTVAPNTNYQYRVVAVNQAVPGSSTGETPSATVLLAQAPAAPASLTATKGTAAAQLNWLTLNWLDQATQETGYVVQRALATVNRTTGAVTWAVQASLPTATSVLAANLLTYVDKTSAANAVYQYSVKAVSGALAGTAASVVGTTATALVTATQLQALGASTKNALSISWQASSSALATGYEVQRCVGLAAACKLVTAAWSTLPTAVNGVATSRFTDSGLATKTSYSYRLRAVNSVVPALMSPWSAVYTAKTL